MAERRSTSVLPPRRWLLLEIAGSVREALEPSNVRGLGKAMVKAATVDYIMDDPGEAARLEAKADPEAWVRKYMGHHMARGREVLSVGSGPGASLRGVSGW